MIDEKQIKKILQDIDAPQPDDAAKSNALSAAMEAFDTAQTVDASDTTTDENKEIEKNTQGLTAHDRLKGENGEKHRKYNPLNFWRQIMKKRFIATGLTGAVATCAILVMLGGPTEIYRQALNPGAMDDRVAVTDPQASTQDFSFTTKAVETSRSRLDIFGIFSGDKKQENKGHLVHTKMGNLAYDGASSSARPSKTQNAPHGKMNRQVQSGGRKEMYKSSEPMPPKASGKSKLYADGARGRDKNAVPTPIGRQTGLMRPDESTGGKAVAIDPLQEWRKTAEPQRFQIDFTKGNEAGKRRQMPREADGLAADRIAVEEKIAAPVAPGVVMPHPEPEPAFPIVVKKDDVVDTQYKDVGEDEFEDFKDNTVKTVQQEPISTFSIDVDTASYAFMRRMINNGSLPQKDAVRVEELINYFDYNYPVPETTEQPFQPTVAVYDSPWKAGNKLLHIGIKGHDKFAEEKPRSNLVFLIDTSGSMNNQDKLPLLINSMKLLVDGLGAEDTIGIVTYAGRAGVVLEPTKVTRQNKGTIIRALENLRSGGSTAGAAGIRQAYDMAQEHFDAKAVNRVILATDGDFNVGIRNHSELQDYIERKRDTGVFLSVLGFGQGNYHDNLMQTLAQNGNGQAAYIDTLSEARKVLVDEAASTLYPIAKDVKIQVEFNPKMVSEYRLIGYETRALNREDFNNDAIDAGEIGAGHTVTAIYEVTPTTAAQNRLVDDLRYGQAQGVTATLEKESVDKAQPQTSEYAYLKMRYKLPNENTSKLLTRAITAQDEGRLENMSDDVRFAAAVSAFGQKLRGGRYLNGMSYDDIITLAQSARGDDPFGYRVEFINLVKLAKSSAAMPR